MDYKFVPSIPTYYSNDTGNAPFNINVEPPSDFDFAYLLNDTTSIGLDYFESPKKQDQIIEPPKEIQTISIRETINASLLIDNIIRAKIDIINAIKEGKSSEDLLKKNEEYTNQFVETIDNHAAKIIGYFSRLITQFNSKEELLRDLRLLANLRDFITELDEKIKEQNDTILTCSYINYPHGFTPILQKPIDNIYEVELMVIYDTPIKNIKLTKENISITILNETKKKLKKPKRKENSSKKRKISDVYETTDTFYKIIPGSIIILDDSSTFIKKIRFNIQIDGKFPGVVKGERPRILLSSFLINFTLPENHPKEVKTQNEFCVDFMTNPTLQYQERIKTSVTSTITSIGDFLFQFFAEDKVKIPSDRNMLTCYIVNIFTFAYSYNYTINMPNNPIKDLKDYELDSMLELITPISHDSIISVSLEQLDSNYKIMLNSIFTPVKDNKGIRNAYNMGLLHMINEAKAREICNYIIIPMIEKSNERITSFFIIYSNRYATNEDTFSGICFAKSESIWDSLEGEIRVSAKS
jgi:hypothetical protein